MGQSIGTLFRGNLNALGLGSSLTADEVTKGINLDKHTAIVTGKLAIGCAWIEMGHGQPVWASI